MGVDDEVEAEGRHGRRLPRGGVTTTGTGTVQVAPDVVVVRLAAQVASPHARDALERASSASAAMIDALLDAAVARTDLRTRSTSSWTDDGGAGGPDGPGRARLTTVTQTLEVTLRDVVTAGETVARALDAAGEAGRLEHTGFAVADPLVAVREARDLAFAQAVAAAAQLAELAGRRLGPVLDVREEESVGAAPRVMAMAAPMSRGVPLEGGLQDVVVRLVVRHAWAEPA